MVRRGVPAATALYSATWVLNYLNKFLWKRFTDQGINRFYTDIKEAEGVLREGGVELMEQAQTVKDHVMAYINKGLESFKPFKIINYEPADAKSAVKAHQTAVKRAAKHVLRLGVDSKSGMTTFPFASGNTFTYTAPKIHESGSSIHIHHKEFVGAVVAVESDAGSNIQYQVNPGLGPATSASSPNGLFTWLNDIAKLYEYHRFNHVSVHYNPTCATTTPGYVTLSPDLAGS